MTVLVAIFLITALTSMILANHKPRAEYVKTAGKNAVK